MVTATSAGQGDETVAFSAIDPCFDDQLITMLIEAQDSGRVLVTSALSRYSRNSEKLHRILEFLLAHGATILTTNYLIRTTDVWGAARDAHEARQPETVRRDRPDPRPHRYAPEDRGDPRAPAGLAGRERGCTRRPSWTCCWCRTPIWVGRRWRGWSWPGSGGV